MSLIQLLLFKMGNEAFQNASFGNSWFPTGNGAPQGGNETEIMLRARYSGYGGMKLDPKVVEKRWKPKF